MTLLVALVVPILGGCTTSSESVCVPGRAVECRGALQCLGAQVCRADGLGYGECVCDPAHCEANFDEDPAHCGGCFRACAPGLVCQAGACVCPVDDAPPSFSNDVAPIFAASCAFGACHHVAGSKSLSLLPGEAYAQLVDVPTYQCNDKRVRVAPGAPVSSYLVDKMIGVRLCSGISMPPGPPLPADDLTTITRWICAGAPDN